MPFPYPRACGKRPSNAGLDRCTEGAILDCSFGSLTEPSKSRNNNFMSGWKARIGYLSPSVFETPSDWDYILSKGFTIVASGLNVQAHTTEEFNKAIDALEKGSGIFIAEECDAILLSSIT